MAEKNERLNRELKASEERLRQAETQIRNKEAEITENNRRMNELEGKVQRGEEESESLRERLQIIKNEKEKSKRIN